MHACLVAGLVIAVASRAEAQASVAIDIPAYGSTVTVPFAVAGWAIDTHVATGTGVDWVDVWAYPGGGNPIYLGPASYGGSRPDVAACFGDPRFTASGYGLTVTNLAPGSYQIVVYARTAGTQNWTPAVVNLTVPTSDPLMWIDIPAEQASVGQPFTVAGWAIDRGAPSGTGVDTVHVWAYRNPGSGEAAVFLGVAGYGSSRPDIGAAYGSRFTNSGYWLTVSGHPPGVYYLIVYAHSTVTGTFAAALTRTVVVDTSTATLRVDRPGSGTGAVRANGLTCDGGAGTQAVPCAATFAYGTTVTLTAEPDLGQSFAGWGGACSGTGSCVVTLSGDRLVVASFSAPAGSVAYYHTDALGSVRAVTQMINGQVQVVSRHDFMPFGEEVNPPNPPTEKRLFTGQERDFETGLDYFNARQLATGRGRFTSVDPFSVVPSGAGDPQRYGVYTYAGNNPLRFVDPAGLEWWEMSSSLIMALWKSTLPRMEEPFRVSISSGEEMVGVGDGAASDGESGGSVLGPQRAPEVETAQAPTTWDWSKAFVGNVFSGKNWVEAQKGAWNKSYYSCIGNELIPFKGLFAAALANAAEHTATAAVEAQASRLAGSYYHFTDGRFTAWGRSSRVLVPNAAAKIGTLARFVTGAGLALTDLELFHAVYVCSAELGK
jgi:RHS repeat-associated protein